MNILRQKKCARRAINDTCILFPKGQIHRINVKDECYDVQIELRKEQKIYLVVEKM